MKKYTYKNIILYRTWGTWQANYRLENGNIFSLHCCCCDTKEKAYEIAKEEVDYLNNENR